VLRKDEDDVGADGGCKTVGELKGAGLGNDSEARIVGVDEECEGLDAVCEAERERTAKWDETYHGMRSFR